MNEKRQALNEPKVEKKVLKNSKEVAEYWVAKLTALKAELEYRDILRQLRENEGKVGRPVKENNKK